MKNTTAITNAQVFNGEQLIGKQIVVIEEDHILSVGNTMPEEATIIDAQGATLLPGLIDSHVHTCIEALRTALLFGITTELEMMGSWTKQERQAVAERDDIADVRSPNLAITPPGGHPTELVPGYRPQFPFVTTPEEAAERVIELVAEGADYIKIMIEDGAVLAAPGLPMISDEVLIAAVREAHRYGKMAIAHALTVAATQRAIAAGVDGLAHLFIDRPHTPAIVAAIAHSGAFVTPCLSVNASIMGKAAADLAADERVRARLNKQWLDSLHESMNTFPQGNLNDVFATVMALHHAGVDILAGTDVSRQPLPSLGGLAHGASLHRELQLLVQAGFTPIEALRSATSVPARRFGLSDRGRIAPGVRADLLLVDGDPTTTISDTLSTRTVWRRGTQLHPLA
jgi:imidazolonepropionase-like amidohydrolase